MYKNIFFGLWDGTDDDIIIPNKYIFVYLV
jgi:hypothetical protein